MNYDAVRKQASQGPLTYKEYLGAEFSSLQTVDHVIAGIPTQSAEIMGMLDTCRANASVLVHCWNNFSDVLERLRMIAHEASVNPDMTLGAYFQSVVGEKIQKVLDQANEVKES